MTPVIIMQTSAEVVATLQVSSSGIQVFWKKKKKKRLSYVEFILSMYLTYDNLLWLACMFCFIHFSFHVTFKTGSEASLDLPSPGSQSCAS